MSVMTSDPPKAQVPVTGRDNVRKGIPLWFSLLAFITIIIAIVALLEKFQMDRAQAEKTLAETARTLAESQAAADRKEKEEADLARVELDQERVAALVDKQKLQQTLARSDFLQAEALIDNGNIPGALAHLARSLRTQPEDNPAATLAFSYLLQTPCCLCALPVLDHLACTALSPDGTRILTACPAADDGTGIARVWDAQSGRPITPPIELPAPPKSVQFNPSGNSFITVLNDGTAQIWDSQSGEALTDPIDGVTCANFSPDGARLVTASDRDDSARLCDVATGQPITPPLLPDADQPDTVGDPASVALFSPDGTQVVTCFSDNKNAVVWDAKTGNKVLTLAHSDGVTCAAFSPDGNFLATGAGSSVQVWDAKTGQTVGAPLNVKDLVYCLSFSLDSEKLAVGSGDATDKMEGFAQVWDPKTGLPVTGPLAHKAPVSSVLFNPNGNLVMTVSALGDDVVRLWDAQTGDLRATVPTDLFRHHSAVLFGAFSSDGTRILTASADAVGIWAVRQGGFPPLESKGSVQSVAFSRDGTEVVTASADKTARVWNVNNAKAISPPLTHAERVNSASFSPDNTAVITASDDESAKVWDLKAGRMQFPALKQNDYVTDGCFSPDGAIIVTVSSGVQLWDATTGKLKTTLKNISGVNSVCFSPDSHHLLVATNDGTARIWDVATGEAINPAFPHEDTVNYAAFSPDGTLVVTASNDGTAEVWDVKTGLPKCPPLHHDAAVHFASFNADGSRVVTACGDLQESPQPPDPGYAQVWDVQSGQPIGRPLQHSRLVNFAAFSPDGTRILTASDDETARLWDVASSQPLTPPLTAPLTSDLSNRGLVRSAAFSPDGTRVVTAIENKAIIWDVAPYSTPPDWLPDLLDAIALQHLDESGAVQFDSIEKYQAFYKARTAFTTDSWSILGRWLFTDPSGQALSPWTSLTTSDYVHQLIAEGTRESLQKAARFAYGHPDWQVQIQAKLREDTR